MKEKYLYPVFTLTIILALFTAGCVAPPQENTTFNPLGSDNQSQVEQQTTTQSSFVSEVTVNDEVTTTRTPAGYTTFVTHTMIPQDITCRIHEKSLYGYNTSGFVFNLKNPPMYINYTVVPVNETVTRVYTDSFTKKTTTLQYSDYSPQSWFELTVRSNKTKEVYLQDGFGRQKGYPTYLSRTIKILKTDDMLVEFRGNHIQASASVWVKPIGNFEESRMSEFTVCTYWDDRRDSLAQGRTTEIPNLILTWEPENKITQ